MCNLDCITCNAVGVASREVLTDPKQFPCNNGVECSNDIGMGLCDRLDSGRMCVPHLGVHEIGGVLACTREIIRRSR